MMLSWVYYGDILETAFFVHKFEQNSLFLKGIFPFLKLLVGCSNIGRR